MQTGQPRFRLAPLTTLLQIRARLPTAGAPTVPDPSPSRLVLIDVREPAELEATGRIPTAHNLPISSLPDGLFLPPDEFRDKFGFEKPQAGSEVVFYCKSGIRSHTAAAMVAPEWSGQGIKVGEFPGSWIDWSERGGEAER
jgi:rhodanese-related sulfurtransferase